MMDANTTTPESIARAIDVMQRAGAPWHIPLLREVGSGLIHLLVVTARNAVLPMGKLRGSSKPTVVLICDDDPLPTGPAGWRCAAQATDWCAAALIHGTGGQAQHYDEAIAAAVLVGRVLIVDVAASHVRAWVDLLPGKPVLVRVPPPGGVHPVADKPEIRH